MNCLPAYQSWLVNQLALISDSGHSFEQLWTLVTSWIIDLNTCETSCPSVSSFCEGFTSNSSSSLSSSSDCISRITIGSSFVSYASILLRSSSRSSNSWHSPIGKWCRLIGVRCYNCFCELLQTIASFKTISNDQVSPSTTQGDVHHLFLAAGKELLGDICTSCNRTLFKGVNH